MSNPSLSQRKLTEFIAIHCSASQPDIKTDVKTIDRWHRQRGFVMVGYHYVIKTDGEVQVGRAEDTIGAHVEGYNAKSIGICLVGGVDAAGKSVNNYSKEQMLSLLALLKDLRVKYPKAAIRGHRDFPAVKKDCPCFSVANWLLEVKF